MRKIFICTILLLISSNLAIGSDDLWNNYGDTNSYHQEAVTDQDFQKALESKKIKQKKKKNKNIPKGESFSQSNETEIITNTAKDLPILIVPLNLKIKDKYTIPTGHYQVEGIKEGKNVFLNLYQAHYVIAKIPVTETNDDFGENSINFVKILPYKNNSVKIIYGGIDFNAYSIIDIQE